jgi:transcriptional regulator with XRE-family HTH domain
MKRIKIEGCSPTNEFGKRLARLRKESGLSLRGFSAQLGISHRMLYFYESKGGNPPLSLIPKMAQILGVSIDQLFGVNSSSKKTYKSNGKQIFQ